MFHWKNVSLTKANYWDVFTKITEFEGRGEGELPYLEMGPIHGIGG